MVCFQDLQPLVKGLPKMVILSDVPWGPIERICSGFLDVGLDVAFLCLTKKKRFYAEHVHDVEAHFIEVTDSGRSLFNKYLAMSKVRMTKSAVRQLPKFERPFFNVNMGINLSKQPAFANAGLVLVCSAPGLVDWSMASSLFSHKAVVARLASSVDYTGYCVCTAGCMKWKNEGCGQCPQLEALSGDKDFVRDSFIEKQKNYHGITLGVATPSSWMGRHVQESLLLGGMPQFTIPTSVNFESYAPQPRDNVRAHFDLPRDAKIVLYGSGSFRANKGFHLLCQALGLMRENWSGELPLFCFFGQNAPREFLPEGYRCVDLGYLDTVEKLAAAYSAADVFVSPSLQDNLPNTVNEALSCGTPVVCFDRFSSEDVVINGITGYTAKHPGLPLAADGTLIQKNSYSVPLMDLKDLADKIGMVLQMPRKDYQRMRTSCRKKALEFFSPVLQIARYLQAYRQLLGLPKVSIHRVPEQL